MNIPELSIAVPFHNEENNIEKLVNNLVKEFESNKINYELILVDNASEDRTSSIVDNLSKSNRKIKSIHNTEKGYGVAILSGLKLASGEYVGYIDGDLEVLPSDVIKLYKKIKTSDADLIKGIKNMRSSKGLRKMASIFYDFFFFSIYFSNVKQLNAKPKIIRKECLRKLNLNSKDWFIDTEIIIKSLRNNYKILSEPTTYIIKEEQKSNISISSVFEFLKNLIKYRFI